MKVPYLQLSREHTLEHADLETAVFQLEVVFEIRRAGSASHCLSEKAGFTECITGRSQSKDSVLIIW